MKVFKASIRALLVFTILTGLIYPIFLTVIGKSFFSSQTSGSLIELNGKIVGSELIAQKTESDSYFQPRPSASGFGAVPSGASNLGPISKILKDEVQKRRDVLGFDAPPDLLMASGSGLDPHISIEAANFQIAQIVKARGFSLDQKDQLTQLILDSVEASTFGVLGQNRVNVLKLNILLNERFPRGF